VRDTLKALKLRYPPEDPSLTGLRVTWALGRRSRLPAQHPRFRQKPAQIGQPYRQIGEQQHTHAHAHDR
jgi:hypothetical protein